VENEDGRALLVWMVLSVMLRFISVFASLDAVAAFANCARFAFFDAIAEETVDADAGDAFVGNEEEEEEEEVVECAGAAVSASCFGSSASAGMDEPTCLHLDT